METSVNFFLFSFIHHLTNSKTGILLKCLARVCFIRLVCNAHVSNQCMEHEHLYPAHSLPHFLSIFCYVTLWDLGLPSPCLLWLAQHQLKGSATVINSQGYSCGSTSTAVCANECWIRGKSESNFYSKGSFLCFSVLCWHKDFNRTLKRRHPILHPSRDVFLQCYRDEDFDVFTDVVSRGAPLLCVGGQEAPAAWGNWKSPPAVTRQNVSLLHQNGTED